MQQNKAGVQKLYKRFGLFSIVLILSSTLLNAAGSFENFKRSQAKSFKNYKDERDTAFNKYLKAEWKSYSKQKSFDLYEQPKPTKIPKAKPHEIEKVGPKVNIKVPKPKDAKKPQAKQIIIVKKIKPSDIEFDFFGTRLGFNISQDIKSASFYPRDQEGIINFFDSLAASEYAQLLEDIKNIKKDLNLNDWGLYLLVHELSKRVYNIEDNSKLLSWFIFNKLGYAVKIGLVDKHVVLLHYSEKIIYSTPSYSFANKKFYAISKYAKGHLGRLYSYEQNYPGSDKPLDLSLNTLPKFTQNTQDKELGFKDFKVSIKYNQNIIDFMGTYPQADYDTFFNAPMQKDTYEQLAVAIKKYVDGKKTSEALNFVLHFVQKSFEYQRDEEQFRREKVMFAQEALYYDKSDCEDRAVLFSYLVKKLFKIGVLGVKYKDHMATALYIPMSGDSVKAGSKRFVIADPTYINSNIGQSMPKYRPIKPQSFIMVNKN